MSSVQDAERTLRQVSLFVGFDQKELNTFVEFTDPVRCKAGSTLMKSGEQGRSMFIVIHGRLKAAVTQDGREVVLAHIGPGEFFGELSLIDEYPRSADVVALEDCMMLKVTNAVIETFMGVYPRAAFKILIAIAKVAVSRLRESDRRVLDFVRRTGVEVA